MPPRGCAACSAPVLFPRPRQGRGGAAFSVPALFPRPGSGGARHKCRKKPGFPSSYGQVLGRAAASRGRAVQTVHNSQSAMDNPDAQAMDKLCITVGLLYTAYPQPAHRVTHGCLRRELYTRLHSPGGAPRHPPKPPGYISKNQDLPPPGGGPALVRTWGKAPAQNRRRRPVSARIRKRAPAQSWRRSPARVPIRP